MTSQDILDGLIVFLRRERDRLWDERIECAARYNDESDRQAALRAQRVREYKATGEIDPDFQISLHRARLYSPISVETVKVQLEELRRLEGLDSKIDVFEMVLDVIGVEPAVRNSFNPPTKPLKSPPVMIPVKLIEGAAEGDFKPLLEHLRVNKITVESETEGLPDGDWEFTLRKDKD